MSDKMVERVMKSMRDKERIRNIAICAHIDHGKTTFSDNLLSGCGMMSKEDAGKALKLDFHDDEQERGITIDTAAVSMVHVFEDNDFLINLLDTPGHVDF
ncbi:MAG: GTP-binding protein, partial [Candidatus Woesearchaeota archaeon]|nr:GTP-binding protein [Candidatus Woesearchaeota archaeon]